jgi:hypothetical protein
LTPGNSSSCANESIPSPHHRAKTTPLKRSIWFPRLYLTRQRKRDDSLYFLRKQHLKRDEDGYLYTSRHIRVLFAYSLARKLRASRLRQRISTIGETGGRLYSDDFRSTLRERRSSSLRKTPSFPVDAKSISPVRGNHEQLIVLGLPEASSHYGQVSEIILIAVTFI